MKRTRGESTSVGEVRIKKRKARRILRPDEKQKAKETIAVGLPPFERFYAGLLRSEAKEYLGHGKIVLSTICDRLALPTPSVPLASSYNNLKDHFSTRAALVIEEARQSLADSIRSLNDDIGMNRGKYQGRDAKSHPSAPKTVHDQQRYRYKSFASMELSITRVEHKGNSGHSIVTFSKQSASFTKEEVLNLRQGTIFSCLDLNSSGNIENTLLGVILPQNRDEMVNSRTFVIMIFRRIKKTVKGKWILTPIISLLSEQRKFEACMNQITAPVPFLVSLLGIQRPTHIRDTDDRFSYNCEFEDKRKQRIDDEITYDSSSDCEILEIVNLEATFQIPQLNRMQEIAACAFLKSKSDTITLVQGPPGTGKTTLLTSVICRYVIESRKLDHKKRCLMVCAPTNKAVTVLCSRFLNTFLDDESCPCNVVLLGDEDKLLENEIRSSRENKHAESPKLRESFLYTFIDTVESDYSYIRRVLDKGNLSLIDRVLKIARRLDTLLSRKVRDQNVSACAKAIVKLLKRFSSSRKKSYPTEIVVKLDSIIGMISAWNRDDIFYEVLESADVVFCTLGSSGSSLLKKVIGEVDDLIVDEAAAATEPEIYIPFQYLPRRLLCVGDPKQLPATITSQFAEKMGLSKSLHERLMYDCNYRHIMLDTQYRMRPELSEFPSKHFYANKLINGRNVVRPKYNDRSRMVGFAPYTLFQVDGTERQVRSGSFENEVEAKAVVEIVEEFKQASRNRSRNWCAISNLRIITFYQAQVNLIKRLLRRRNLGSVLVATVDSSQGCEADFVIVSFVRSKGTGRNTVGFVADDRRLNVALTRAKFQLICVGNIDRMATLTNAKAESVKRLAIDAGSRKCVHRFSLNRVTSCQPTRTKQDISHGTCGKRDESEIAIVRKHVGHQRQISSAQNSRLESDSESSTISSSSASSSSTSSDDYSSQDSLVLGGKNCDPKPHQSRSALNERFDINPSDGEVKKSGARNKLEFSNETNQPSSPVPNRAETVAVFENFSF